MRDIGGRPKVILVVVCRCAIKVVTCNRNQEEKDAFDVLLYPSAYLETSQSHNTGRLYISDAPGATYIVRLLDNLYTADLVPRIEDIYGN